VYNLGISDDTAGAGMSKVMTRWDGGRTVCR
jgi:hypothetical protein